MADTGVWVLEGECGECGKGYRVKARPIDGAKEKASRETMNRAVDRVGQKQPFCTGFGCSGWTITWYWILVPSTSPRAR